MKELRYTGQYKKDLKGILNNPKKLKALNEVLDMLRKEIPLPLKYKRISCPVNMKDVLNVM